MAYTAGARVITLGGRTGNVAWENAAVTDNTHPSCIVLYADETFTQEPRAGLTNISGSWLSGVGPGN